MMGHYSSTDTNDGALVLPLTPMMVHYSFTDTNDGSRTIPSTDTNDGALHSSPITSTMYGTLFLPLTYQCNGA
ncbi:unnamed protein product, partial [Staurois parvus]